MNFNVNKNIVKIKDVTKVSFKNFDNKVFKKLKKKKNKSLGRSFGQIVCWHRGGGKKRHYRTLFLNNSKNFVEGFGIIRSIEYDPNRSAFIGLIQYENGSFSYIVLNSKAKVNNILYFSKSCDNNNNLNLGDNTTLRFAPIGVPLYNLEKNPGSGAIYSRAAGVSSVILSKIDKMAKIKLASGEEKLFDLDCLVTVGTPSNLYRKYYKKYKAGTNRLLNKRPTVRGVAMNPIDHPHGGGEGKTSAGRPSVSPWGKLTKGVPTRKKYIKNKFIIKRK